MITKSAFLAMVWVFSVLFGVDKLYQFSYIGLCERNRKNYRIWTWTATADNRTFLIYDFFKNMFI